jgi:oligogalacturonide lyase
MCLLAALAAASVRAYAQSDISTDWIDPDTGHRVIRLSREAGSQSSYFHQNEFTPDGKKLVFTAPTGLYTVDLQTRAIEQIRSGRTWLICVGRKTGSAYYLSRGDAGPALWAVNPGTKEDKKVVDIPPGISIANINCDETLAGGTFDRQRPRGFGGPRVGAGGNRTEGSQPPSPGPEVSGASVPGRDGPAPAERDGSRTRPRGEQRPGFGTPNTDRDMQLVTVDLKTGAVNKFNESRAWLNHVQFSPTDPQQMLFCHEGTWQLMDRTWIIRTDGTGLANEWSVHFNISPDQKLFCGDGGGPHSVAAPDNGQWIYLFRPHVLAPVTGGASDPAKLIQSGHLEAEKLVNLARHDYTLEPNCQFTPDGKWIVFRSNLFGPTHIFAVEVAKARP